MSAPATADREPLMTVTEVAAGLHVGLMTVRRMIHRHELRAARVGKLWRIPVSEYERVRTPESVQTAAVELQTAQALGVSTSASPGPTAETGEQIRIFKRRAWEQATTGAASSAAGRSRSADTKKRSRAATQNR
jgi:excisionase family DNA binding protein